MFFFLIELFVSNKLIKDIELQLLVDESGQGISRVQKLQFFCDCSLSEEKTEEQYIDDL